MKRALHPLMFLGLGVLLLPACDTGAPSVPLPADGLHEVQVIAPPPPTDPNQSMGELPRLMWHRLNLLREMARYQGILDRDSENERIGALLRQGSRSREPLQQMILCHFFDAQLEVGIQIQEEEVAALAEGGRNTPLLGSELPPLGNVLANLDQQILRQVETVLPSLRVAEGRDLLREEMRRVFPREGFPPTRVDALLEPLVQF